jgi:tetratricopeptide (TPR) repeat protein
MAEQAIDQFKEVLQRDPKSVNSVKGIAYLYLQEKKFDDAKEYYHKALEIDPNDPESYYTLGVIAWTQSYKPRMEERAKLGLKPDQPLKDQKVCQGLRDKNWGIIQEGLDDLKKALDLRPDYDDAMAYTNLLYRERADLECGDMAARAEDDKTADDWVNKTMATKKAKAEKQPTAPGAEQK